ncbi:MAG: leucyl/phenylalanyl-tRNA---protein transferase [Thermoanaerobaculia bacterium]|jgi:leucyl/phenylalanyl-tRNA--protein transferase|nr:leucyl/phenylalanyl-tRNA---protein transferase [Thermoanaerobaculia bacterium]
MSRFPDPRYVRGDVVAIGDDLSVETLRDAYRHGIFPWPHEELPLPWFSPRRRTVIIFDDLHVGRSLRKTQKRSGFTYSIDRAFEEVIASCAASPRGDDIGTWIGPDIIEAYTNLHRAGDAHSVEVWDGGELVGGLYGVDAGGVFTGESMFHRASDASKLALLFLIEHLRERGASWIDCQVTTPHMAALGAREISRNRFLDMLAAEQAAGRSLFGKSTASGKA